MRTTIASLREIEEALKLDVSDLIMARAELSTEMSLRFRRTAERFIRVDEAILRVAGEDPGEPLQDVRKSKRRNAQENTSKV